jgi:hypothetical protein
MDYIYTLLVWLEFAVIVACLLIGSACVGWWLSRQIPPVKPKPKPGERLFYCPVCWVYQFVREETNCLEHDPPVAMKRGSAQRIAYYEQMQRIHGTLPEVD